MKHYLRLFLVGALISGCAAAPTNPWDDVQVDVTPVEDPLALPGLPVPTIEGDKVVLTAPQAAQVREYGIIARANTDMAGEYAGSINERKRANAALVDAGKAQRVQSEIRLEMLEDERRHNFFEKIGLYIVIIALGVSL